MQRDAVVAARHGYETLVRRGQRRIFSTASREQISMHRVAEYKESQAASGHGARIADAFNVHREDGEHVCWRSAFDAGAIVDL